MSVNLKDKKIVTAAAAAAVIAVVIAAIFLLSGNKGNEAGPEVISKRAKISIDESLNTAASVESSAAPAPANAAQQAASPAPKASPEVKAPAPVPVATAAPQPPAQAKPASAPAPAIKAVAEPKPEVKKAVEAAPRPEKKAVKTEPVKAAVKEPAKKAVAGAQKKKHEKTKMVAEASVKKTGAKPWAINVASFPSLEEAQSAAGRLRKAGYKTYITHFTKDSVTWHRVRVGFFNTRGEAQKAGKDIKKKLQVDNPWIVKPDSAEMKAHY